MVDLDSQRNAAEDNSQTSLRGLEEEETGSSDSSETETDAGRGERVNSARARCLVCGEVDDVGDMQNAGDGFEAWTHTHACDKEEEGE